MLSLSNALTLLRLPAAFLFIIDSVVIRICAVVLAMCSDMLDGYFARKHHTVSQLGAVLDPIMDKFFVFFTFGIMVVSGYVPLWGLACIISRDVFLFMFGIYITVTGGWDKFEFRSIIWGKITTAAQFIVLILVVLGIMIPWFVYVLFIPLGMLTALALYLSYKKSV